MSREKKLDLLFAKLNAFEIALSIIICMFADDFLLLRGSPKKGGRCIFTL